MTRLVYLLRNRDIIRSAHRQLEVTMEDSRLIFPEDRALIDTTKNALRDALESLDREIQVEIDPVDRLVARS